MDVKPTKRRPHKPRYVVSYQLEGGPWKQVEFGARLVKFNLGRLLETPGLKRLIMTDRDDPMQTFRWPPV